MTASICFLWVFESEIVETTDFAGKRRVFMYLIH